MVLVHATALLATALATPVIRQLALRLNVVDQPAARKYHTTTTPYLGGVAVAIGLVIATTASGQLPIVGWWLLGLSLAIGAIGLVDDVRPISWRPKLGFESALALAAAAAIWILLPAGGRGPATALMLTVGLVTIVLVTNSFNLTDNMDGHCASLAAASNTGLALVASYGAHPFSIAALPISVSAACLAFLAYNMTKPMKIFLGDCGSLLLGSITTMIAVILLVSEESSDFVVALPLFLAVPILDTATVSFDRHRHGVSIFTPGKDHLSHRLASRGLGPRRSVAVLAILQLIAAVSTAGFLLLDTRPARYLLLLVPLMVALPVLVVTLNTGDLYITAREEPSSLPSGSVAS